VATASNSTLSLMIAWLIPVRFCLSKSYILEFGCTHIEHLPCARRVHVSSFSRDVQAISDSGTFHIYYCSSIRDKGKTALYPILGCSPHVGDLFLPPMTVTTL